MKKLTLTVERKGQTHTETSALTMLALTEAAKWMIAETPLTGGWRIVALKAEA